MSIQLIYGPQGSGKTAWAESQQNDQTQLVDFKDAYIRCKSSAFDWKPNPEFFRNLNANVDTLIIDSTPTLHTVRWAGVYHKQVMTAGRILKRIYLSQKHSNLLPLSVRVSPFSLSLTA